MDTSAVSEESAAEMRASRLAGPRLGVWLPSAMLVSCLGLGFLVGGSSVSVVLGVVVLVLGSSAALLEPGAFLALATVLMTGGLGLVSVDSAPRVAGVFSLADLVFLLTMASTVARGAVKSTRFRALFRDWWILALPVLLFAYGVILAVAKFGVPVISAIQAGRPFLYYLLFWAAFAHLADRKQLARFWFVIAAAACIGATLLVLGLLGGAGWMAGLPLSQHVSSAQIGGVDVGRVYLPGGALVVAGFAVAYWSWVLDVARTRRLAGLVAAVCGVGCVMQLSRAVWIQTALIVLLPTLLPMLAPRAKAKARKAGAMIALVLVLGALATFAVGASGILGGFAERAYSAWTDTVAGSGTLGFRLSESTFRFRVLSENWIMGTGFIHPGLTPGVFGVPDAIAGSPDRWGLNNPDLGVFGLVVFLGVPGVAWLLAMIGRATRLMVLPLRRPSAEPLSGITLGAWAYLATAVLTSLTLPHFTAGEGIVVVAILLGTSGAAGSLAQGELPVIQHGAQPDSALPTCFAPLPAVANTSKREYSGLPSVPNAASGSVPNAGAGGA